MQLRTYLATVRGVDGVPMQALPNDAPLGLARLHQVGNTLRGEHCKGGATWARGWASGRTAQGVVGEHGLDTRPQGPEHGGVHVHWGGRWGGQSTTCVTRPQTHNRNTAHSRVTQAACCLLLQVVATVPSMRHTRGLKACPTELNMLLYAQITHQQAQ